MLNKRSTTDTELRKALAAGEIVPYFQPIVQIRTGVVAGFEVLARWLHPVRGVVPPDDFIPLAERAGLIGPLTETIMLQAFAATGSLRRNLRLSVNISPIQLRDRTLPALIRRAAAQEAFPLVDLTIEITESALLDNLDLGSEIALELKKLGVRISLDDFGTGYSSLHHLQALPFDDLKVDRTFVNSMISSRRSRKIVAAVVGLGQSLNLTTVAEGIENIAQADMLVWLGCELGQGWLYGPPVSQEHISEVLSTAMPTAGSQPFDSHGVSLIASLEQPPSQQRAQYHAIYDGAPVGLCFLDTDLRHVSINQRLAEMNGVSVEAHLGRSVADLVRPDLYTQIEPYLLRALNGQVTTALEVSRPMPNELDGQMTTLSYLQPATDEAGEVIGISVAVMDITKRKQAEEELREIADHYRYTVELHPHITWTMDQNGMNTEAGPKWEELTGQTREQTMNEGFLAALHPGDVARLLPVIQASLRSGDPIDVEYRVLTRAKRWRWMRSRAKARRGPDGKIMRWYGILEDIDEFKREKQTFHKAAARLKALAADRASLPA